MTTINEIVRSTSRNLNMSKHDSILFGILISFPLWHFSTSTLINRCLPLLLLLLFLRCHLHNKLHLLRSLTISLSLHGNKCIKLCQKDSSTNRLSPTTKRIGSCFKLSLLSTPFTQKKTFSTVQFGLQIFFSQRPTTFFSQISLIINLTTSMKTTKLEILDSSTKHTKTTPP